MALIETRSRGTAARRAGLVKQAEAKKRNGRWCVTWVAA